MVSDLYLNEIQKQLNVRGIDYWTILKSLNKEDRLNDFLHMIHADDLANTEYRHCLYYDNAKILVIGESKVAEKDLQGICKRMGFSKDRFEFRLGYEVGTNFDYEKLKYTSAYELVIFGAIGHSTRGKGDYSSIIEAMRWQDCYPNPIKATVSDGSIKITRTSFKEALIHAVENNMVFPDCWESYNSYCKEIAMLA